MSIADNMMLEAMREDAMRIQLHKSKRMIWVTFQKEGIHKYPAALDDPKLATGGWDDVSFLGYPHRHIFISGCQLKCSTTIEKLQPTSSQMVAKTVQCGNR